MTFMKTLYVIAMVCSMTVSIISCGKQVEDEEDSLTQFTQGMSEFPVDYYVSNEMKCGELHFDSMKNKVYALCFGYGFELYTMDEKGRVAFINRFSDGEELQFNNDGTILSHYSGQNTEVICISLISNEGKEVSLLETYALKIEEGVTHYYKGVNNIRKDYVGEHTLADNEWDDSVITAEMFMLDSAHEIGEKKYKKEIRKLEKKMQTIKYEEMLPYEGPNVYPGW